MRFAKSHEWVRLEGDIAIVGISHHAQDQLSDIVFVDLPEVGKQLTAGESFMSIESVKAASDIYAPLNGEVVEVNQALSDVPEKVNDSPEDEGWLVKIKVADPQAFESLLSKEDYEKTLS